MDIESMRLWTAHEVAAFLGLNVETIYRWSKADVIPHVRVRGSVLRFDQVAIRRWATDTMSPVA